MATKPRYSMTISRLTVDKLGVRLYDKVSAVMAELIANSYDADAKTVKVYAPMDELLATKKKGVLQDRGFQIRVEDDGIGMTPAEINDFYLKVGAERREDSRRGALSRIFKRKVMGRKGVGKLAPFGICTTVEVISSGGDKTTGVDADGKTTQGYETAHLILDRSQILQDTDKEYHPTPGPLDGKIRPKRGTTLVLRDFSHRHVPSLQDFERQLAQRFGLQTANWRIDLYDNAGEDAEKAKPTTVGSFTLDRMPETEIRFVAGTASGKPTHQAIKYDGEVVEDLSAGFEHDGTFYPVSGWIAYAKAPYKDDLMAGIRIYCHGKIAAQTSLFNHRAGFTGEYDIRSYLIGELHADWLDENEDLIQTDRRDILWSDEVGRAFEDWGQKLVLRIGKVTRNPLKKKAWDRFKEVSKIEERVEAAFPGMNQKEIRERAVELARIIGQTVRESELDDTQQVESLVQLSLNLAPHVILTDMLRQAGGTADSPLVAVTSLLRTARFAELSSFGQIAEHRVQVIGRVEILKDETETLEDAFQELITQAPWLVDPQWSPITSNQSFSTLKKEFAKLYKKRTGDDLSLGPFTAPGKRADFVMANQEGVIQIVEIKKPTHKLTDAEVDRMVTYVDLMHEFLTAEPHKQFAAIFSGFHVTLVCDGLALGRTARAAFSGLKSQGILDHVDWTTFLLRTRRMHEDFLNEADRQKRDAARE
ncbi:MAG TPA: ATP-binding protein [Thermoanaerobaculia bacterium]|nr:ATP-binding protein [Thermoanaerobaculia bacterium]